ncbi:MAG: hypothetical protein AAGP08_16745, partial [Pseudomonadota bacterium]
MINSFQSVDYATDLAITALWILGAAVVIWLILRFPTAARSTLSFVVRSVARSITGAGNWVRRNYWRFMIVFGLALGIGAAVFYLYEIGLSVVAIVDRLVSQAPTAPPTDLRNLATATAVLLAALAAAATLIFQLVKVWTTERATTANEEGLITDRINKAVEGLGAEKTITYRGRFVAWQVDGKDRNGFVQKWGETADIADRLPKEWQEASESERPKIVDFGAWENISETQPNLEVRLGAIYALERISQDSLRDHVQIMEILCAYLRENATEAALVNGAPRTDIQAAIRVIGRRGTAQKNEEEQDKRHGTGGYRLDLR